MKEYQAFPISNFRTGFNESVEPWLLPRDAYQQMINAHLYRGVLEKIQGYRLYAKMTYRNKITLIWTGIGNVYANVLPRAALTNNFLGYATIVSGSTAETFTYSGDGVSPLINLVGSAGGSGTYDTSTRQVILTLANPLPVGGQIFFMWDSLPAAECAIMGIKQYFKSDNTQEVLVFDQKRMGKITSITGAIASISELNQLVTEIPHQYYVHNAIIGDGVTTVFTSGVNATALPTTIYPGSVRFKQYLPTGEYIVGTDITDNGTGGLTGTNVTSGSINYLTGAYTITFTVAPVATNYFDAIPLVYADVFTGTISNFFSLTNYQYNAFFTNNVDPIFYYDGTSINYLNTNFTSPKVITATAGVPSFDIIKCLHIFAYRERLLLISYAQAALTAYNAVVWSRVLNPFDFTNNEILQASTSEPIFAIGYITTNLIIRFKNSERILTYTGDAFAPFRFDSTNNLWACDAPYSSINYDSWFSSVGRPAIVGSNGVNVERVDEMIPDFTDPTRLSQQTPVPFINQNSIGQCYGERFDDIKEGWLCYNSLPVTQSAVTASDNVLAFSYLDGTYAIYDFPFSCLGYGRLNSSAIWGTTFDEWESLNEPWDSYQLVGNSLIDLAGDQFDKVYQLNIGNAKGDNDTPILISVISKNFNPFIEQGQLARLGYVDLFVSAYATSTLRVQFYVNDQLYIDGNDEPAGYYKETTLTFTPTDSMSPTTSQTKVWKRIYVGAVGKSHTIRFYQNEDDFADTIDQPIYIHSMVLYMKPAGMIFN